MSSQLEVNVFTICGTGDALPVPPGTDEQTAAPNTSPPPLLVHWPVSWCLRRAFKETEELRSWCIWQDDSGGAVVAGKASCYQQRRGLWTCKEKGTIFCLYKRMHSSHT